MSVIQKERIQPLNQKNINLRGRYVLYWMQASQRSENNFALEYAIEQANELAKPLLVAFGLMDDYPEANLRHYTFMLEGLKDVQEALAKRRIKMIVQHGNPESIAVKLGQEAALVVVDRGYLKIQKQWYKNVASQLDCPLIQVEDNVVVPVESASNKTEFAARTIRPKINKQLNDFFYLIPNVKAAHPALTEPFEGLDLSDPYQIVKTLKLNHDVPAVSQFFKGGQSEAKHVLERFLSQRFENYDANRNQPQSNDTSYMAMYLHFGHISPIYLAKRIKEARGKQVNSDSYLEELIVRRELAMNFVSFTANYDDYGVIPDWAKKTLAEHKDDLRDPCYSLEQLENAETIDPYWNAAMNEMRYTGYMHNYMRMYWAKKILEWTPNPEDAFKRSLYLNNKYFLDGRDANSYAGVTWCYGVHDRAWTERAIFGKIRYMNANGLKRKAKPDEYIKKVAKLVARAKGETSSENIQESLF